MIDARVPKRLDVHIIMDNYSTHKTALIRNWVAKRPRFHQHFTPTYRSWLSRVWQPVRYYGTPQLVSLNSALTGGFNIHLSGDPGRHAPGGACFGDSGGPSLVGDTNIVGGVGFVLSPNCTGARLLPPRHRGRAGLHRPVSRLTNGVGPGDRA